MDCARTPPPLHAEPGGMIIDFSEKNRTSNQESGPQVLSGALLIIHFFPNVAGSAADRSYLFWLNDVVVSRRWTARELYAEPGGKTADFSKKKADLESRRRTSDA